MRRREDVTAEEASTSVWWAGFCFVRLPKRRSRGFVVGAVGVVGSEGGGVGLEMEAKIASLSFKRASSEDFLAVSWARRNLPRVVFRSSLILDICACIRLLSVSLPLVLPELSLLPALKEPPGTPELEVVDEGRRSSASCRKSSRSSSSCLRFSWISCVSSTRTEVESVSEPGVKDRVESWIMRDSVALRESMSVVIWAEIVEVIASCRPYSLKESAQSSFQLEMFKSRAYGISYGAA